MNCLVTGGSRGIGLAVAREMAAMGYGVTLCARNADVLHQRRLELSTVRDQQVHDIWPLDMADLEAVGACRAPKPLSDYTAFVNCAGVAGAALTLAQSSGNIEQTLRVNLHAPILLSKMLARAMIRREGRKDIVYVSSIVGRRGVAGSAVYGASKAGLEAFARSFAREVGPRGIAVNSVAPGLVNTDMGAKANPRLMESNVFPGLIEAEEVARTVRFLLESKSVTGSVITVDSGCSV